MGVLTAYKPNKLFQYFEEISRIPRGSGNTDAIADYCVRFAEDRGLAWERDTANNVVIRKPASSGAEQSEPIILQGHIDMVCEKEPGKVFDFEKDAIELVIEGDTLRANGTTLGGDNGIAVAMMLAILDDETLTHPPLEILLTSDEEIGMVGAFAFDCSKVSGHKLINLDSEEEGVLMCSCAGGLDAVSTVPVKREAAELTKAAIRIDGLKSGHSGVEINKGRANANVLIGRLLKALEAVDYRLIALEGGVRETAIAPAAEAVIGIEAEKAEEVKRIAAHSAEVFRKEFASAEPGLQITVEERGAGAADVLTKESTRLVQNVLLALPDSVQSMSIDMPGLVQTSVNFGMLKLEGETLQFTNTVRSSMTTQKHMVAEQIAAIVSLAGGSTAIRGEYPGWAYNPNSVLKDTILTAYKKITGKEASVEAVHAGLECGLFADSIENLDCVSIGPAMGDVHTPQEWLNLPSAERTFTLLKEVLAQSVK